MQLRCHLCSAPSFRTSFHSPQKKGKELKIWFLNTTLGGFWTPSCPLALSGLHLQLPFNPQSPQYTLPRLSLLHTSTLITHPSLFVFSPQAHMLSPPVEGQSGGFCGGVLDSVTHRGAEAAAFAILRPSPHAARPSGLYSVTAALWDDERRKKIKEWGSPSWARGSECFGRVRKNPVTKVWLRTFTLDILKEYMSIRT